MLLLFMDEAEMELNLNAAVSPPPSSQAEAKPVARPRAPELAAKVQPAVAEKPAQKQAAEPVAKEIRQAVEQVRKQVEAKAPNELSFSIDQETGRSVVRIVDRKSGEVIRQIPAQEMLDIAKSIDKMQGLLLKQAV
jgi:flagellar protein FlaG